MLPDGYEIPKYLLCFLDMRRIVIRKSDAFISPSRETGKFVVPYRALPQRDELLRDLLGVL